MSPRTAPAMATDITVSNRKAPILARNIAKKTIVWLGARRPIGGMPSTKVTIKTMIGPPVESHDSIHGWSCDKCRKNGWKCCIRKSLVDNPKWCTIWEQWSYDHNP